MAPDAPRFAALLKIETGARQADSPESVGRWRTRFDSWARNESFSPSYADPIRGENLAAAELRTRSHLNLLAALHAESFSTAYDGAKAPVMPPAVSAGTPPAKPKKPSMDPPISPQSNLEAVIEATAVLPRGLWDAKSRRRVSVTRQAQIEIAHIAFEEAALQGLDPLFVLSFIAKESAFYAKSSGPFEEFGLMQLMPQTAKVLAAQTPNIADLVRTDTRSLKVSTRSCDLLAAKLLAEGKLVRVCAKAPPAATAGEISPKKPLKADYIVEYLDLHDSRTNIRLGVSYIKSLWDEFSRIEAATLVSVDLSKRTDIKAVISAYNAGAPAVAKSMAKRGRPPLFNEEYVSTFIDNYYGKVNRRFQTIARSSYAARQLTTTRTRGS